jgi:ubiquinone biosynthesis monooxygenase Coq7
MSPLDRLVVGADNALRTLTGAVHAARANPADRAPPATALLADEDRRLAGALMRVNHVGEVCAQALYQAQALTTADPALREELEAAARDESDHLAWTRQRLTELRARPSVLNPLWYGGAFAMGLVAGRLGGRIGRSFVVETERQVEQHLAGHLDRLPAADARSRAIVEQMRDDERRHGDTAQGGGGRRLPAPMRWAMRAAAKVMTVTAHRL